LGGAAAAPEGTAGVLSSLADRDSSYLNAEALHRLKAQALARQRKIGDSPPLLAQGASLDRRLPTRVTEGAAALQNDGGSAAIKIASAARPTTAPRLQPGGKKDERVTDLIGFLDSVDEKQSRIEAELGGLEADRTLRAASERSSSHIHDGVVDPSHAETAATVTKLILQQQLELKEKDEAIASLKRRLDEQEQIAQAAQAVRSTRESIVPGAASGDAAATALALEEQLKESNLTINRHLKFIDRLIQDKKGLSERCEQLVAQVKETDATQVTPVVPVRDQQGGWLVGWLVHRSYNYSAACFLSLSTSVV
jgi:hypothetical protein